MKETPAMTAQGITVKDTLEQVTKIHNKDGVKHELPAQTPESSEKTTQK